MLAVEKNSGGYAEAYKCNGTISSKVALQLILRTYHDFDNSIALYAAYGLSKDEWIIPIKQNEYITKSDKEFHKQYELSV